MNRIFILAVLLFCVGASAQVPGGAPGLLPGNWQEFEADNGLVFQVDMSSIIVAGNGGKGREVYIDEKGSGGTEISAVIFDCEGHTLNNNRLAPIPPRSVLAKIERAVCSAKEEPAQKIGTLTSPVTIPANAINGNRIFFVEPQYPPKAKLAQMSGTVVLRVTISKTGNVEKLQVDSSTNGLFNNSAMDAVKQWRYRPYLINNKPTEVNTTITVNFALNGGD